MQSIYLYKIHITSWTIWIKLSGKGGKRLIFMNFCCLWKISRIFRSNCILCSLVESRVTQLHMFWFTCSCQSKKLTFTWKKAENFPSRKAYTAVNVEKGIKLSSFANIFHPRATSIKLVSSSVLASLRPRIDMIASLAFLQLFISHIFHFLRFAMSLEGKQTFRL